MHQLAITSTRHVHSITQQGLDPMSRRRVLPFAAAHATDTEDSARDLHLSGTGALCIERLQHTSLPRPLLGSQTFVWWNHAIMKGTEQPEKRFQPLEPLHIQRNNSRKRAARIITRLDNVQPLTIAEREQG